MTLRLMTRTVKKGLILWHLLEIDIDSTQEAYPKATHSKELPSASIVVRGEISTGIQRSEEGGGEELGKGDINGSSMEEGTLDSGVWDLTYTLT